MVGHKQRFPAHKDLTYGDIERIAGGLRQRFAHGLKLTDPFPCLDFFERLDRFKIAVHETKIPLDYAVENLPKGVEAQARYDEPTGRIVVSLDPKSYDQLVDGQRRARFTLCHEVGHAFLHAEELVTLAFVPHYAASLNRVQNDVPVYRDVEWQANGFAAALLVPAGGLSALERAGYHITAKRIYDRYQVSWSTAGIRLDTYRQRRRQLLLWN